MYVGYLHHLLKLVFFALGSKPMDAQAEFVIFLRLSLCLCLLFALLRFSYKQWWIPTSIQKLMQAQGIKGPPYKFVHGNTKEILDLKRSAMSKPVTDVSHQTFARLQPYVYLWTKTYGKNYVQWSGPQPQLLVTESEMVKEIMSDKDGTFPKADAPEFTRKLLGDGIVMTNIVEKWRKLRKLSNHAFHGESLRSMIPAMIESVETMLGKWKDYEGQEIEVYKEFRLLTCEIISRTAFGSNYLEGENIFEQLNKLGQIITRNAWKGKSPLISKFTKSSDDVEAEKLEKGIRDAVLRMIRKREENVIRGEADSYGDDFLGSLMNTIHDPDESKMFSLDEIVDECKSFYSAGHETSNGLLAWIMLLLAVHSDWQEAARKEVIQIFGGNNPTPDGLSKLKTVGMIINETLRLYPPVTGFLRNVKREVRLGKLVLPANLHLFVSNLALHYDPQIWGEDVNLFKPQRFSEGVAKATNNDIAAYIPFGLGPRNCVGLNFASSEAKIAISMILQKYSFTLSPAYVHSPCQILTVRPQYGVQIVLQAL